MGYGHQRAAFALKDLAHDRIITANDDEIITESEKRIWQQMQRTYETISRLSSVPLIGKSLFRIYDRLQDIKPLYPFRDLSVPNFGVKYLKRLLKKGICKSLLQYMQNHKPAHPMLTTFYVPALAANFHTYKQPAYCVVTDTDINRIWVCENPKGNKVTYFVPTERSGKRLQSYGIEKKNIIKTGFPLPKELIGTNDEIVSKDFANRLVNLDPRREFDDFMKKQKGVKFKGEKTHPLTLTFIIGGAGAQQEILYQLTESLKEKIKNKELQFRILFGTHLEHAENFRHFLQKLGLANQAYIEVQVAANLNRYFTEFTELMHETDILFTKPSEMSFYAALGIPIVALPALGAHEHYNLRWLQNKGCVVPLDNPQTTAEWLFDLLEQGVFAKAAIDGYLFTQHRGVYNIEQFFKEKYGTEIN